ncbi:alkaline ceramidase ydc1 [Saxophila tyrrhenica]|uniref:Alkaline ceramidase ydc1 n=1 Tax=Saxophila tyrrhenica TaxID=1690608 RepID=A0AAV9P5Y4_9PEZI|nr:alkaline ceramidase ydc1 [Saxophila tyrrhenica]
MLSWLPSIPYAPEQGGYWDPITSTLDWCEENYYATEYAAEIVNTLTNLWFMYLAFKGMFNCRRNGHDNVFFVAYLGYLLVGAGSFAFHATLKYPMQLVDELSMIYTTCLMFWATFAYSRPQPIQLLLGVFSVSLALFITGYYHYLQDPTFHQNAYAILTAIVLFRSIYVMELNIRPFYRQRHEEHEKAQSSPTLTEAEKTEEKRKDRRDSEILRTMWVMIAFGLSIFLGGFGIWTLDNVYCSKLRAWRHEAGLPWGIVLEGHGWWHVMTGFGAYCYIQWGIWLRHCLNGRQDEFEMVWPAWWSVPRVEKVAVAGNGSVSKKTR